jgi:hypothetical protein
MEILKQDKGTNCGQTCTAMIAGVSIRESERVYGKHTASNFSEAKKALKHFGVETGAPTKLDNRKKWTLPSFAYVRIVMIGRKVGHAIVYKDGYFYDPHFGVKATMEELKDLYNMDGANPRKRKWKFQWYMEVLEQNTLAAGVDNEE